LVVGGHASGWCFYEESAIEKLMGRELVAEAVDDLDVAGVAGFEPEGVNRRIAEASLGFEALAVGVGEQEERVKRGPNIVGVGAAWRWRRGFGLGSRGIAPLEEGDDIGGLGFRLE